MIPSAGPRTFHRDGYVAFNCVIPRPGRWAYSPNFPDTDVFAITTGVYCGGVYSRLCFVDLSRSAELKDTGRWLRPRFFPVAPSIGAGRRRRALLVYQLPNSNRLSLSAKFAPWRAGRTNRQLAALATGCDVHSSHPAIRESYSSIRRAARMCRARTLRRDEYFDLSA